jgi:hypothetical protein
MLYRPLERQPQIRANIYLTNTAYGSRLESDENKEEEPEEPVTLCVAAECEYQTKPAIAMCCDWRAQTGAESSVLIGSEDVYKMIEWSRATAMLAGHPTDGKELAASCRVATEKFASAAVNPHDFDLAINDFLQELRVIAIARKKQLLEHFIGMRLGGSLQEFLALPSENYLDTWAEFRQQTLGADILLCCVTHEPVESVIIRVDRFGKAHWQNNYFAIGEGSEIARGMLCLQNWYASKPSQPGSTFLTEKVPLAECLYRINEAKTAAHIANPASVGADTAIQVITPDGRYPIDPGFAETIKEAFAKKHVVPDIIEQMSEDKILGPKSVS